MTCVTPHNDWIGYSGICLPGEICVDYWLDHLDVAAVEPLLGNGRWLVAECRDAENAASVKQRWKRRRETRRSGMLPGETMNQIAQGRASGTNVSAVAILTDPESTMSVNASTLQIAAQSSREIFGAESWSTLSAGLAACSNCERLTLQPIPAGTQRIEVSVILPEIGSIANLYTLIVGG